MVQPSGNDGPNQQRGNKRPFSNAEGGPPGDQGRQFQRQSFDNRPFNRGGNRSFDRGGNRSFNNRGGNRSFNNGNRFNKDNNFNRGGNNQNFGQGRGNQNFNRGNFRGRNNQNFRRGGFQNNKFNKSWEGNRNAPDFEQNPNASKHKKFDEETEEAAVDRVDVDNQPKNKKLKNPVQNVELIEDDETSSSSSSSESEEEIETNLPKSQNADEEDTSSESEKEIETRNDLQKKQIVKESEEEETSSESEEEETSSESEEEIEVNSKTIQNKNEEDEEDTSSESEDEIGIIKASESEEQKEIATSSKNKSQASTSAATLKKDDVNSGGTKSEDQCKIYVRGLPHSTNKEQMEIFFKRYGKIQSVIIKKERFVRAIIIFEKAEDAEKALEVNGMIYKDHRFAVHRKFNKLGDIKTILARKIPFDATHQDVWNAFEITCGPIRNVILPLMKSNVIENKGFAFVEFELLDSKELALAMKQITIKNKVIEVVQYDEQEKARRSAKFLREAPFNKHGPRRFSGEPSNVRIHPNQHNKSFTITFGDNSYQGPPKFNARKPYVKSRRPYN